MYASDISVQNRSDRSQSIFLIHDYLSTANHQTSALCLFILWFVRLSSRLQLEMKPQNAEVFPENFGGNQVNCPKIFDNSLRNLWMV